MAEEQLLHTMRDTMGGVLHPVGFAESNERAYAHALRLAVAMKTSLTLLGTPEGSQGKFPGVRQLLERWGELPSGSEPQDVADLGIWVRKIRAHKATTRDAVLGYMEGHSVDLLVVGSDAHAGIQRLLHRAVAAPTTEESGVSALFVPPGCNGFVSTETGQVRCANVVIPVATRPAPDSAINLAASVARHLNTGEGLFTLLFVGDENGFPPVTERPLAGWSYERVVRQGNPVQATLEVARELSAELIVMTTAGRQGLVESLTGSTADRIVRESPCPVLTIPAHRGD